MAGPHPEARRRGPCGYRRGFEASSERLRAERVIRASGGRRAVDPAAVAGRREEDQPDHADGHEFEQAVSDRERNRPIACAQVDEVLDDDDEFQAQPECAGETPEQEMMAGQRRAE